MTDKTLREKLEERGMLEWGWGVNAIVSAHVDALAARVKAVEEWMNRCRELAGLRLAPEPAEPAPENYRCRYCGLAFAKWEDLQGHYASSHKPAREQPAEPATGPGSREWKAEQARQQANMFSAPAEPAPDKPDFSEIARKWAGIAQEPVTDGKGMVISFQWPIERACEEAAEQATAGLKALRDLLGRSLDTERRHVANLQSENHKLRGENHAVGNAHRAERDRLRAERDRLRQELDEALAKQRIDEDQCNHMTEEASRLATDLARLKAAAVPSAEDCEAWVSRLDKSIVRDWMNPNDTDVNEDATHQRVYRLDAKSATETLQHFSRWLKRRVEEATGKEAGDAE